MVYFTKHALERIKEQGLSYQLVINAIKFGIKMRENKDIIIKWQRLNIIMDNHNKVITVYLRSRVK